MCEKKFHEKSVFATFTYNDEHLPKGGTLVKKDCQKLLKRLRKKVDVRFFLAGEYGDIGHRPHYHAILFGVGAEDVKMLEDAWSLEGKSIGYVDVKNVEYGSCAYVARYVVKKQVGRKADEFYEKKGVIPEFCLMSRGGRGGRGGIGNEYIKKFGGEIFNRGFMVEGGNKAGIPKYFVSKIYDTDEKKSVRRKTMEELQGKKDLLLVARVKEMGYNWRSEVERLDAEGTEKMLKGRLRMMPKKL